ncbi:hypothetical protein D3C87_1322240 [compost metagenome]
MFPVIFITLISSLIQINSPHKLSPAENLTYKTFQRIDRDFMFLSVIDCFFQNTIRSQKSNIKQRRKHAMMQKMFTTHDTIFIHSKISKSKFKKLIQPIFCFLGHSQYLRDTSNFHNCYEHHSRSAFLQSMRRQLKRNPQTSQIFEGKLAGIMLDEILILIDDNILGFQIVHHIIQTKKCSVQINKMFRTSVGVHPFHIAQFRIPLT